jgi:heme/copper-type cytochrome/quinol oxidase subunit 2
MTTTSVDTTPATRTPSVLRPAGLAVLLSAILTAVLIGRDTNNGPAWRVGLVLAAVVLAVTALVFGLVVRRVLRRESARASAWTALVLGLLAVASLVVFWLALPPVFGVAALTLARDARDRRPFRGEAVAVAAAVLAALGTVAAFVASAIG